MAERDVNINIKAKDLTKDGVKSVSKGIESISSAAQGSINPIKGMGTAMQAAIAATGMGMFLEALNKIIQIVRMVGGAFYDNLEPVRRLVDGIKETIIGMVTQFFKLFGLEWGKPKENIEALNEELKEAADNAERVRAAHEASSLAVTQNYKQLRDSIKKENDQILKDKKTLISSELKEASTQLQMYYALEKSRVKNSTDEGEKRTKALNKLEEDYNRALIQLHSTSAAKIKTIDEGIVKANQQKSNERIAIAEKERVEFKALAIKAYAQQLENTILLEDGEEAAYEKIFSTAYLLHEDRIKLLTNYKNKHLDIIASLYNQENISAKKQAFLEQRRLDVIRDYEQAVVDERKAYQIKVMQEGQALFAQENQNLISMGINLATSMQNALGTAFTALINNAEDFGTRMRSLWTTLIDALIGEIAKLAAKAVIFQGLMGLFNLAGGTGFLGNILLNVAEGFSGQTQFGEVRKIQGPVGAPQKITAHGGEIIGRPGGLGSGVSVTVMGSVYGWKESMEQVRQGLVDLRRLTGATI